MALLPLFLRVAQKPQITPSSGPRTSFGTVEETPKVAGILSFHSLTSFGTNSSPQSFQAESPSDHAMTRVVAPLATGAAPPSGSSSAPTMKSATRIRPGPFCAKISQAVTLSDRDKANTAKWEEKSKELSDAWESASWIRLIKEVTHV